MDLRDPELPVSSRQDGADGWIPRDGGQIVPRDEVMRCGQGPFGEISVAGGRLYPDGVVDSQTFVAFDVDCLYGDAERVKQRNSISTIWEISTQSCWRP